MPLQIALPVRLDDDAVFANFHVDDSNAAAVARLRAFVAHGNGSLVLHGASGSGRTHLLHASRQQLEIGGATPVYLPLAELRDYPAAELFAGLESHVLVCLDDIDALAGDGSAEEALFDLFNRCAETGARLLMSARLPPAQCGFRLADLASRLAGGLVIALAEPDDEGRIAALMLRARHRGMHLEPEVARYAWSRSPRDMRALIAVLDRLDTATLEAGRRPSIPFLRELMGW